MCEVAYCGDHILIKTYGDSVTILTRCYPSYIHTLETVVI